MAIVSQIEIIITGPYVSCDGKLCLTMSDSSHKMKPDVFVIIGVEPDGRWIVEQVL